MPRGDGTGPAGMGPMTGRGLGYCAGYSTPGYVTGGNCGGGMGFGRGRGCGRGMGMRWRAPYVPYAAPVAPQAPVAPPPQAATNVEALQNQVASLEKALADARRRLDELSD